MEIVTRTSVRALLVTPENEVLMIRIENSSSTWKGWITPGGGIDAGESHEQALRRELREELGLTSFTISYSATTPVWTHFKEFPWSGKIIRQSEVFYLVRLTKFDPRPHADQLKEAEMMDFREFKWWPIAELANPHETFAPHDFHSHLATLLRDGMPSSPIDVSEDAD